MGRDGPEPPGTGSRRAPCLRPSEGQQSREAPARLAASACPGPGPILSRGGSELRTGGTASAQVRVLHRGETFRERLLPEAERQEGEGEAPHLCRETLEMPEPKGTLAAVPCSATETSLSLV